MGNVAIKGNLMMLYDEDANALIGATQDISLSFDNEIDDTTTNEDAGDKTHIATLSGWSGDFAGLYNPTVVGNFEDLIDLLASKSSFVMWVRYDSAKYIKGLVILKNVKINGKTKGPITLSGSFEGNGGYTKETSLSSI